MKKRLILLIMLVLVVLSISTVCTATDLDGFSYEISGETVTITGYSGGEANVVIPGTIDSYPVTVIGDTAFSNHTTLESITFPASVTQVNCQFDGCDNLKRIYVTDIASWLKTQFANNLLAGGRELYVNDALLTDLVIPETVTEVKLTDYTHLKSVTVHSQVKSLDFSGCDSIQTVYVEDLAAWCQMDFGGLYANPLNSAEKLYVNNVDINDQLAIPAGTTKIKDYAFGGFKGVQSISLPATVTEIGAMALTGTTRLAQVSVDTDNTVFSDYEGVLFNKDKTQMLHYPAGKADETYTIPFSVIAIADGAIRKCVNLKNIVMGDNVTTIGMVNLCESDALESVTIGKGVKRIGSYVFNATPNLKRIEITDLAAWCTMQNETYDSIFGAGAELYLNDEPLTKLVVPENVTNIAARTFWRCPNITAVVLHDKIEAIEEQAFEGITSITDVWYTGSEEDWDNMQIGNGNEPLTNAVWHYDACPVGAEHNPEWVIDWEGNCGEDGSKHGVCTACQVLCYEDTPIPATGNHTYTNDCDPECNLCKQVRTVKHAFVWVVDLQEGCGDDGLQHEECTICHFMQNKNTKLPANGNHVFDNAEDSNCNVCNQTREAGHDFRWVIETEPTCGAEGSKYEKCTLCAEVRNVGTAIPALEHTMGQWVITKESACEVKGEITKECALCGHKETDFLTALEHNYVPFGTPTQPTCTENGKKVAKCTLCGEEKITVLKAPGHKFNSVVVKEPTEDELGLRRKTCEICNTVKEEPIPATRPVGTTSIKSVLMIILAVVVLLGSAAGIFFIIKTRDKE